MEPLKNRYQVSGIKYLSDLFAREGVRINNKLFIKEASQNIESLEMKERMLQISNALNNSLEEANHTSLIKVIKSFNHENKFLLWPISQLIEDVFIDDLDKGMKLIYELTQKFTGEFVIRAYLNKYENKVYKYLHKWVKDKNEHVRRLVSEGTRLNLPWGKKVEYLNQNYKRNFDLLDLLHADKSDYVRTSVANHMNDICRIDADCALEKLQTWSNESKENQKLNRLATRYLLKIGNKSALLLNGFSSNPKINDFSFSISPKKINEGDEINLNISFQSAYNQRFLFDYVLYMPLKNGELSKKIFRLKEFNCEKSERVEYKKSIKFKKVTTRKHYSGEYKIELKIGQKVLGVSSLNIRVTD